MSQRKKPKKPKTSGRTIKAVSAPAMRAAILKPKGLKYDAGKLRYDLEPQVARQLNIAVMSYGAVIHGDNNWRGVENGKERYYAALERHMAEYRLAGQVGAGGGGTLVDHESRIATLAHALTSLTFLVELECKALSREQIAALFARALEVKAQKEAKR